jgi:hypothetical protein
MSIYTVEYIDRRNLRENQVERGMDKVKGTDALSAKISTLKPLAADVRAQQIRDVVDAFRRLRSSVVRFVQMFASTRSSASADDDLAATSLRELLSILATEARAAHFARQRELKLAIRQARLLERTRDAVFSETFSTDPHAMREAVTALERVDAILVSLCVEHVLERHKLAPARLAPARRRQAEPAY